MWSPERAASRFLFRLAGVLLAGGLVAGCFQPLYGERSLTGGPVLREALAGVQIAQVDAPAGTALARLAVEMRNELSFLLTGGAGNTPPTHRLVITMSTGGSSLIVDPSTARPEFEIVSVDAYFRMLEAATGKEVINGQATARVSYDIPGQQQRFTMLRGQRDAQSRAAKVVAEQIRTRLASYFAAGT